MEHTGPGHRTRASYTVSSVLAALASRWRRLDLAFQTLGIRHPRVKTFLKALHVHDKDDYSVSEIAQAEGLLVASAGDATLRCLRRLARVKLLNASKRSLVYCVIARVHMKAGRDADAESACRAAVDAGYSSDRVDTLLVLADEAYRAKRYRLAATLAGLCLDPAPSDPKVAGRAHFLAGISHAQLLGAETAGSQAAMEHAKSADQHFRSALYTAGCENFERLEAYKWLISDELTRGTPARLATEFKRATEDASLDVSSKVLNELFDPAVSRCEQSNAWLELAAILGASGARVPVRLWRPGTEIKWHKMALTLFSSLNRSVPAALARSTSEGLAGTAPCSVFSKVSRPRCFSDTVMLLSASLPEEKVPDDTIQTGDRLLSEYLAGSRLMTQAYEDVMSAVALDSDAAQPSLDWLGKHADATNTEIDRALLQRRIRAAELIRECITTCPGEMSSAMRNALLQTVMTKVVLQNEPIASKHLDTAIDELVKVAQIERRVPILLAVVLIAHGSGFVDHAYKVLQGAISEVLREPSKVVRLRRLLLLCDEARCAGFFGLFPSLFEGSVMQGQSEAFNGWAVDNGTTPESRGECERLEIQFKFLKRCF